MYGQGQGQMPGQQYGQAPNNRDPLGRSHLQPGRRRPLGRAGADRARPRQGARDPGGAAAPRQRAPAAERGARLPAAAAAPLLSAERRCAAAVAERRRAAAGRAGRHPDPALYRHAERRRGARAAARSGRQGQRPLPDRRGRHAWWRWCRRARAPGTPASAPGRAARGLNDRSIGIELVNPGHEWGYRPSPSRSTRPASRSAGRSSRAGRSRRAACSATATWRRTRKQDPGELFDWPRLAAAGIGLWPAAGAGRAAQRRDACRPSSPASAMRCRGHGRLDHATRLRDRRLSAPFPAASGSTAWPTPRTLARLDGLLALL